MGSGKKKSPILNGNKEKGKRIRESPEILGETPGKPGEGQRKRLNLEGYAEVETLNKVSLNDDEMLVNTRASREEIGSSDKGMSDGDNMRRGQLETGASMLFMPVT